MRDVRILSVSTFTVAFAVVITAALTRAGFVGLSIGLSWLWTSLMLEELHDALPEDFHFERENGRRWVTVKLVTSLAYAGLVSIAAVASWLTFGWADDAFRPFLYLLGLAALMLQFAIVMHILSAVETLEHGENRDATVGIVLLNMLLPPLFVVLTHQRVRREMRRRGALS